MRCVSLRKLRRIESSEASSQFVVVMVVECRKDKIDMRSRLQRENLFDLPATPSRSAERLGICRWSNHPQRTIAPR